MLWPTPRLFKTSLLECFVRRVMWFVRVRVSNPHRVSTLLLATGLADATPAGLFAPGEAVKGA